MKAKRGRQTIRLDQVVFPVSDVTRDEPIPRRAAVARPPSTERAVGRVERREDGREKDGDGMDASTDGRRRGHVAGEIDTARASA